MCLLKIICCLIKKNYNEEIVELLNINIFYSQPINHYKLKMKFLANKNVKESSHVNESGSKIKIVIFIKGVILIRLVQHKNY